MIRLGIISDTHYPTRLPNLPFAAIEDAFRNVDAILHAGDIETPEVLNHLSGIAPVQAVCGDNDTFDLPLKRVIKIGGVRIGLAHGHYQNPLIEEMYRLRRKLGYSQHRELTNRLDMLMHNFKDDALDVLVFGHSHRPMCSYHNGMMLFNPGAVYTLTLDTAQWQLQREKNPLRRRMLKKHIERYQYIPQDITGKSTVGILEIDVKRHIQPRFIELPLINYESHKAPTGVSLRQYVSD